ncbi:hypothetical protein BBF96_07560 [Anoxybacter fermentans]|uniref:Sugar ABC transporter substrate-binding protein n=1 Tax=Anoxybacter fermentans TaxID=1323375 RepID=A0A3S9SYC3_9FIRM|nr:sugar ABC transporter substrate-binding protein [Anoxybacter fermentans]AZR73254.1 hypothetical protein BBF96_07560 [Anoxybacter fermentans]
MHKKIIGLIIFLVLLLNLCSLTVAAKKPVTITFATWSGVEEGKELQQIVDKINARHKDFQIKTIHIPGDYYTKLQVMIAGGTPPDIFYLSQEFVPDYASKWVLMNLTPILKKDPEIDLDDYYSAALETSRYQGQLYGLPWIYQPFILYYNKDLFDKFNVPYPKSCMSWEQFVDLAQKMTKDVDNDGRIDYYGFVQQGTPELWIWQNGGHIISSDRQTALLDQPEALGGVKFFHDIIHKYKITPSMATISEQGFADLFKTGKVAMFIGGAADGFYDLNFNVGAVEVPQGKVKATFSWTASLVISSSTKHKKLAYQAWKELLDGIQHWKIAPPRKSLMAKLKEIEPRLTPDREEAIRNSMAYARGFTNVVGQSQISRILWEEMSQPIWLGKKTPEEAVKIAARKINEVLKENQE